VSSSITAGYKPVSTERTIADDGAGALTGSTLTAPGTIDYETGAYSFTIAGGSAAPYDRGDVRATYTQDAWAVPAISAGAWGENLKLELVGNDDYFTTATGVYSRFDLRVFLRDSTTSPFALKETFSALDFVDENSNSYAPVVVNDADTGSKLIELTDPPFDATGPSGQLNARARTAVLGVGNRSLTAFGSTSGSTAELVIGTASPIVTAAHRADPLTASVQPRTVRIVYRANGDTVDRVITDDGSGNLTGDVGTGTNKVNYDTGHLAFVTSAAPDVSGLISCTYSLTPTETASEELFDGGSDGVAGVGRTEMTSPSLKAAKRGMYALTTVDEFLNLGIMDLAGNVTCALDQQTEAETNQRWFVVLCTPQGMTPQQAKDYRRNTLGINSSYCALYYPWVRIADPVRNRNINIPPLGHVIGVYARTDANKSVGKAPAGTEDGKLLFSTGLERNLTFDELDILDPNGVNALIDTPQTGRVVWGASTLESPPADFEFVHARRLFIFLERSTFNGSFPFVWENIGPSLWSRVKTSMEGLLYNVWQSGALKGDTQDEAFRVVCELSNNPIEVQRAKRVICDVYAAVNDPGKYLHFRFSKRQS
jgi:phage tail sheath protein FI